MPDQISLNFINRTSSFAEPGLKSTDQRFKEAAFARDSVITTKSHRLATPAVRPCCALERSRWVLTDDRARSKPTAEPFCNAHATSGIPGLGEPLVFRPKDYICAEGAFFTSVILIITFFHEHFILYDYPQTRASVLQ